ncbi:MAG: response regulator, partial [Alphaproteobacteria bacterium]|nr:response regulator [Alphaproteobacteria bacterium]
MEKQKIVIVDKNPIIRSGLLEILQRDGRFTVTNAVVTGGEFIGLVESGQADIGIIGWSLPDMTGGQVLARFQDAAQNPRIIIYTGEKIVDVLR